MSLAEQNGQEPVVPQTGSEAGPLIRDECRAARIAEVTEFAECLATTVKSCPHRFTFNAYLYCLHPRREIIIAHTLAEKRPPDK